MAVFERGLRGEGKWWCWRGARGVSLSAGYLHDVLNVVLVELVVVLEEKSAVMNSNVSKST